MADQGAGSGRIVLVGAPTFEELPPSGGRQVRDELPPRHRRQVREEPPPSDWRPLHEEPPPSDRRPLPEAPPASDRRQVREDRRARVQPLARRPMQPNGWTTRRLTTAAVFGAGALGVGALLFVARFGSGDGSGGPLLAAGFGLFVVGMVVFCAALIALLGTAIARLATLRGWPRAAALALGPPAFAWGLLGLGVVGFAIPAVLSLILISAFVVALR